MELEDELADFERFEAVQQGEVIILRLHDSQLSKLGLQDQLSQELYRYVDERKPSKMVIIFQRIAFCPTGVIETLIRVKKRLSVAGGVLKILRMNKQIRHALRSLELEGMVFEILDSEPEAVQTLDS